jgi:hypothetical protein
MKTILTLFLLLFTSFNTIAQYDIEMDIASDATCKRAAILAQLTDELNDAQKEYIDSGKRYNSLLNQAMAIIENSIAIEKADADYDRLQRVLGALANIGASQNYSPPQFVNLNLSACHVYLKESGNLV